MKSQQPQAEHRDGDAFHIELYKTLRTEYQTCISQMSGLWIQKLTLVGAAFLFLFGQHAEWKQWTDEGSASATPASKELLAWISFILPAIALLLDLKHFECLLNARKVSLFIAEHFKDVPLVAAWERFNWGSAKGVRSRALARYSALVSITFANVPTVALFWLPLLLLGSKHPDWINPLVLIGLAFAAASLVGAHVGSSIVWPAGFRSLWELPKVSPVEPK